MNPEHENALYMLVNMLDIISWMAVVYKSSNTEQYNMFRFSLRYI